MLNPLRKQKTAMFEEYQQRNSFKGIKFGTHVSRIIEKMDLKYLNDFMSIKYSINNSDYVIFNDFSFDNGETYFTRDGELFQVLLHKDQDPDGLSKYLKLRKTFIELFGGNDTERSDIPTRLIGWEGRNMLISLGFDPDEDNKTCKKGSVSLMVINNKLNAKHHDEERPQYNGGIPKM